MVNYINIKYLFLSLEGNLFPQRKDDLPMELVSRIN